MPRPRIDRDEARARIVVTANRLFRQYGHTKTTVADIAAELRMSPANIYKFFASREAIVEASVEINLAVLRKRLEEAVRQARKPVEKLEAAVLAMIRENKDSLRNERQLYKLVLMATENNWACVQDYIDSVIGVLADIIAEGNRTGEFRIADVTETAQLLFGCLQSLIHPLLTQDIEQAELEKTAIAQVRLLVKALR